METIKFAKVRDVKLPERGTPLSAGIDFFVPKDFKTITVWPGNDILIPSGIKAKIPSGYMLMGADKSGIAPSHDALKRVDLPIKNKLIGSAVIIGAKIIDEDYPGEIHIHLINVGDTPIGINPDDKIAQFILVPVLYANIVEVSENDLDFSESQRKGGFGSTTE